MGSHIVYRMCVKTVGNVLKVKILYVGVIRCCMPENTQNTSIKRHVGVVNARFVGEFVFSLSAQCNLDMMPHV